MILLKYLGNKGMYSTPAWTWSMESKILEARTVLHCFISSAKGKPSFLNARSHFLSAKPNPPHVSQYRKQISVANLFQRYGFPPSQLHSFVSASNFLVNSNLHDIEKSLAILLSFKIPHKLLVSLITECPGILEFEFLKKWEICFSKSKHVCISPLVIRSVLAYAKKFQIDPDGFINSLKILKGLGFSEVTTRKVLAGCTRVIAMKKSEILRRVEFYMQIGISRDEVDWVLNLYPEAMGLPIENRLVPLLHEFEDLGFGKELITKEMIREPRILSLEVGELSKCLELLSSLKCREPIKLRIFSDGPLRAGFEVKLRIDCLCKHGLIRREALKVLWKEPRVIIYGVEDIDKKIEFLVNTMRFDVACLVEVPEYLGVSFEKQIVPRYNVIEYLRAKGGLGDEVTLKGMIKLSRLKFYNLYVKPYPECSKMFGRFSGGVEVKNRHPAGLWALFKPQMNPDSQEDVKNVKSFMEGLV